MNFLGSCKAILLLAVLSLVSTSSIAGRLVAGQTLKTGERIYSSDNAYFLNMQNTDGNLVLYKTSPQTALWASNTQGHPNAYATMQTDGNFVVYSASGVALWASGTAGNSAYLNTYSFLNVQTDGNLVVYAPHAVWNSNTPYTPNATGGSAFHGAGSRLLSGQAWSSPDGAYTLAMQAADGNLVMYKNSNHQAIWLTGTQGHPGAWANVQPDGNFCVYTSTNVGLWCTMTNGASSMFLAVQANGDLAIYGEQARWARFGLSAPTSSGGSNTSGILNDACTVLSVTGTSCTDIVLDVVSAIASLFGF